MKSPIVVIIFAVCSLFLACCCCGSGLGNFNWEEWTSLLTPVPVEPEPTPNIVRETPPADVGETEAQLATVEIPLSDLHELAIRLQGVPSDTSRTINPEGSPDYATGTRRLFHVSNTDTDEQ